MLENLDGEFFKKHSDMVRRIARKVISRCPANIELDDLIQEGYIGLANAEQNYTTPSDATFETFASLRIKGAMLDYLRGLDWVSRGARAKSKKIEAAEWTIEKEQGRKAKASEIADKLGLTIEEYYAIERG